MSLRSLCIVCLNGPRGSCSANDGTSRTTRLQPIGAAFSNNPSSGEWRAAVRVPSSSIRGETASTVTVPSTKCAKKSGNPQAVVQCSDSTVNETLWRGRLSTIAARQTGADGAEYECLPLLVQETRTPLVCSRNAVADGQKLIHDIRAQGTIALSRHRIAGKLMLSGTRTPPLRGRYLVIGGPPTGWRPRPARVHRPPGRIPSRSPGSLYSLEPRAAGG